MSVAFGMLVEEEEDIYLDYDILIFDRLIEVKKWMN